MIDFPKTKLKTYGDRSFSAVAPQIKNKLPESMRHLTSLKSSKKELKTHLFKTAFILLYIEFVPLLGNLLYSFYHTYIVTGYL